MKSSAKEPSESHSEPLTKNESQDSASEIKAEAPSSDQGPEARIAALETEVATLKDQWMRALAEAENTRRRAAKEREDITKYAVSGFAKELVSVADSLHRALEAFPPKAREGSEEVKTLISGMEAIERQFLAAFESAGIRKMDPLGKPFDPHMHQVMMEVEDSSQVPGTVVAVLQNGYTIHDRLLRAALVSVAKGGKTG